MRIASFLIIILYVSGTAFAGEAKKEGKPLSLEQIEQKESFGKVTNSLDNLRRLLNLVIKERNSQCLKAFGHEEFCDCLSKNLPVALSFNDYIGSTINTKEDIDYKSMPEDAKELVDNAKKIRNHCVNEVY